MGKMSREKKERRLQTGVNSAAAQIRKSPLENISLWALQILVYASLFTPLIIDSSFFFPYVSPKTIFFRVIVDIILIFYIILIVANRRYLPKFNFFTISLASFIAVAFVTSLTGINFSKSFWSVFERMGGLLTFCHLFVFFLVLTSVFRERKYWERFFTASIFVGIILTFYVFNSEEGTARGGGTIGNTSFLSAYLIFDIFFAIILFFSKSGFWRVFYGLALVPLIWLLLFPPKEPTQGAIGAFYGGLALLAFGFGLYYVYSSGRRLLKKITPILLAILVLAVVGISQTSFVKNKINGIAQSSSWQSRAVVWKMGYLAWQDRPWLGWGQENFNVPFTRHFNPSLPLTVDIWYDRVHNIVFDNLVTSGVIGLLSYLTIFGAAIFGLIKTLPKITDKKNVFLPLGMISLLAVYFVQDLWVFDMISSYMMFFLSMAFINFLLSGRQPEPVLDSAEKPRGISPLLAGFLIIGSLFALYFGNIQPARASKYIIEGVSQKLETGMAFFQKALDASPMAIIEAPEQFSRVLGNLVFNEKVDRVVLGQGFELAIGDLKKAIVKNPEDFRFYLLLGKLYSDFYFVDKDPKHLEDSESVLTKAIELSPKNQQGYWSLSQTRISQGREQDAIDLMQKAVDLEPRFGLSHWYLAMTYKIVGGGREMALEEVAKAEANGYDWRANVDNIKKVIELYQDSDDDQKLAELYSLAVEKSPENAQFWMGLSVSQANLGKFDQARASAQKALSLKPDFAAQIEEFLDSLPK
ncbi:MAG: O-antigen ligase family protein [bacterium]